MSAESPFGSETLEAVLGALPVPAYTKDLRGFFTWQNEAARAVGGDIVGKHYSEAVPAEELPRAREAWAAVTLGGETRRRTGLYKGADGDLVGLEVIVSPIRVDGSIVGVFGIALPVDGLPQASATDRLSRRQLDVLRLLAQAKSTNEIASELHLSPETVRNYIRDLLKALGARSRLEAILIALREGVVSLDVD